MKGTLPSGGSTEVPWVILCVVLEGNDVIVFGQKLYQRLGVIYAPVYERW